MYVGALGRNLHELTFRTPVPEVPEDMPEIDERVRNIERGAKIVVVVPSDAKVVLQMPRGNLETVFPRALVLGAVRASLDILDYRGAFEICRGHRVDLNILYDYNPRLFIENVKLFVDQVKAVEHVDLFLAGIKCVQRATTEDATADILRAEDVSQTLYKDTSAGQTREGQTKQELETKVNTICQNFIDVLNPFVKERLQNLVTAHASKHPPDLESALLLVGSLRGKHEACKS